MSQEFAQKVIDTIGEKSGDPSQSLIRVIDLCLAEVESRDPDPEETQEPDSAKRNWPFSSSGP